MKQLLLLTSAYLVLQNFCRSAPTTTLDAIAEPQVEDRAALNTSEPEEFVALILSAPFYASFSIFSFSYHQVLLLSIDHECTV